MAFTAKALFDALASEARQLGVFERVCTHEPKSPPGAGMTLALWWGAPLEAYPGGSGLSAVSARTEIHGRVYRSYLAKDEDSIDLQILDAVIAYFGALVNAFTLGGIVRNVDVLGESGGLMNGQPAYLEMDAKPYRVADLVIPVVINDLWPEAA
jgi:hypothetical protein